MKTLLKFLAGAAIATAVIVVFLLVLFVSGSAIMQGGYGLSDGIGWGALLIVAGVFGIVVDFGGVVAIISAWMHS